MRRGSSRRRRERFDFLGYTFGVEHFRKDGHTYLAAKPSKKSIQKVQQAVRAALRPGNQGSWPEVRVRLNRILKGWSNYFSHGTRTMAYRAVDHYIFDLPTDGHDWQERGRGPMRFPMKDVQGSGR